MWLGLDGVDAAPGRVVATDRGERETAGNSPSPCFPEDWVHQQRMDDSTAMRREG